MRVVYDYIRSALHNIAINRVFSIFTLLGTAFSFIFIAILVQMASDILGNTPPYVSASRCVTPSHIFRDQQGKYAGAILPYEIKSIRDKLDSTTMLSYSNHQYTNVFAPQRVMNCAVSFVGGDYWQMNEFDFIEGRKFRNEEIENKDRVAILREKSAIKLFGRDNPVGKEIEFWGDKYKVVGIVKEFPGGIEQIWIPTALNKYLTNNSRAQTLSIVAAEGADIEQFKSHVVSVFKSHFKSKNKDIKLDTSDLKTVQQQHLEAVGGRIFSFGLPIALLIFMLVPAINIVTISMANTSNRSTEIAIRRSMGATVFSSFVLIMVESFILVVVGAGVGALLAPIGANYIIETFLFSGNMIAFSLISTLTPKVLFLYIVPLASLFTLISGGIPAYVVARGSIAEKLKGGSKC